MPSHTPPPSPLELRRFGLVTAAIVAALFGISLPWLFDRAFPWWPWIVAGLLVSAAFLGPRSLGPVYRSWMAIGHLLGWINTRVLLGLLFYAVLVPTGLAMRAFGHDPMRRKLDADAHSYRVLSTEQADNHFERPF